MIDSIPSTGASALAGQKRTTTAAGNTNGSNFRAVKRRASKACQCCRARKVRCNVVEHGAPCTNCRLDEVECIITESKRRKKFWGSKIDATSQQIEKQSAAADITHKAIPLVKARKDSVMVPTAIPAMQGGHSPDCSHSDRENHLSHYLYQEPEIEETRRTSYPLSNISVPSLSYSAPSSTASSYPQIPRRSYELPRFIKPTPSRIPVEDLEFLARKGALTLPEETLRNELLKNHFEFVHPYMPLLDRKEFLEICTGQSRTGGKIGLLLFQAVMFTGSAFADINVLRAAGYTSRKAARKAFFTRARLLYDFDHEQDRMTLVQALLLMTYWYETPDDQKDTWHWMGVAISLSHTIGLHRNPDKSMALDSKRKKLWKRIWWSCVMRDRLVALGMRRPTRIKSEDCDVPMLTLEDFEIDLDIGRSNIIYQHEDLEEEIRKQRRLAIMCIQKAKLCVCISHVLTAQYSVLTTNQGSLSADGSTRTTMMLLPKQADKDTCEVERCDRELQDWYQLLPEEASYRPIALGDQLQDLSLSLHRNLLHMVYFTTVSALHRPQVLPSAPAPWPARNGNAALQEVSRRKVRQAASEITRLATELIDTDLVRYLPTTGVTVMLPAIIIHLLDIKSSNPYTRERSLEGFSLCMEVMQGLRQSYASADYATHFLEAAIKKAEIQVSSRQRRWQRPEESLATEEQRRMKKRRPEFGNSQSLGRNMAAATFSDGTIMYPAKTLTPPPDSITIGLDDSEDQMIFGSEQGDQSITISSNDAAFSSALANISNVPGEMGNSENSNNGMLDDDNTLALKLESFLATTPPPPSSTSSEDDSLDQDFDDNLFSATSPPPHINIPDDDDNYYSPHSNNHMNSPPANMEAILGRDMDPFLGHYEDGAELSLRGSAGAQNNNGGKFTYNSSWGGFSGLGGGSNNNGSNGNSNILSSDVFGTGLFGNGTWMEGGADMENVSKLLDGVDFELEDVIQVLESEIS